MTEREAVTRARLEGLSVEFDHHRAAFQNAAVNLISDMEAQIIRDYPQFYTKEQAIKAGVSAWRWRRCKMGLC